MRSGTLLIPVLTLGALVCGVPPLLLVEPPVVALAWAAAAVIAFLVLAEGLFRLAFRLRTGTRPMRPKRIPVNRFHVEPHPFLPYAYKRSFEADDDLRDSRLADYPLHQGRFEFPKTSSNSFRLMDGSQGFREPDMPKPEGRFRVLCLGGSTTANYIVEEGRIHSYPVELERELQARHPGLDLDVINGGMGGWSSAELVVYFLLRLVDLEPDAVVLYHAYNDLGPSLTPGFVSDYSHARKNLGESYHLFRIRSRFPDLPSDLYHYLLNSFFPGHLSNSLISAVTAAEPDLEGTFQGTATYKRNLGHIIDVCNAQGIRVVCSTFCQYLYPEVQESGSHLKYKEGVALENEAMRELAREKDVILVDAAALMPEDDALFVDSVHFTPEGMRRLARLFADRLDKTIKEM